MAARDLAELFAALRPLEGDTEAMFRAAVVPGHEPHRIGRDVEGRPALIIAPASGEDAYAPNITLERLTVQHGVRCRVERPDGDATEAAGVTVVRCLDRTLAPYFLDVAPALLGALGAEPHRDHVGRLIDQLVSLFRAASSPARGTVQGVWAELLLIATATDVAVAAEAWHARPEDRYDFAHGPVRVEVKCASGPERSHFFSLDQLRPIDGVEVIVASVLAPPSPSGLSLGDLVSTVTERLEPQPDLVLHVMRTVAATLGSSLQRAMAERFDDAQAAQTLAYYWSSDVPSVPPELPSSVTAVRFRSDLGSALRAELGQSRNELVSTLADPGSPLQASSTPPTAEAR